MTKLGNVFRITCQGSYETSDLVKQGNYDWSNNWITNKRFPFQAHEPVSRTIELVSFESGPTSKYGPTSLEEVLAEFSRRGLERPTYEDAFYFGIEHPEEQKKHPVVFLHKPILGAFGYRRVLVLDEDVGRRGLGLCGFDYGWRRNYVFAAVRK